MKILFTADWHIKLDVKNIPNKWQIDRYNLVYKQIHELSEEVDAIIIGGDIFDNPAPTINEIALFMDYVWGCKQHHIIYGGNHEATDKGHSIMPLVSRLVPSSIFETVLYYRNYLGMDFLPFADLHRLKGLTNKSNILFTHVRGDIPPHVKAEVDLDLFDKWDLVVAGDLHSVTNSQRNILYPGTPLSTSFHRQPTRNGVYIINTDTLEHSFIELKAPQLIRKTVTDQKDMIKTDYDHTIYELVTSSLEKVDSSNKLLDKKIVKKNTPSRLDFSSTQSIKDEAKLYWEDINGFTDREIEDLFNIYDHFNRTKVG